MKLVSWLVPLVMVACAGGAETCEEFDIEVSVFGPSNEIVTDALVELNNEPCKANGDGTYLCVGTTDGENHLAATHPNYNATALFVEAGEDTCEPVPVTLTLGVMMGA
jgi:hypothetical protein